MAATKTEPQTAVTMKVVPSAEVKPEVKPDSFAPLRAVIEQMVKDAREEGRKAGVAVGRVEGLRRAIALLGIAMGQLTVEDRLRLSSAIEAVEHELTK